MRPSNRSKILESAIRVAEREGVTAVTLDSVAEEAKLTKGGLMYHFGNKEALLDGIQHYLADLWNTLMEEAAGGKAEVLSPEARLAAYARVATNSASSADLAFILESSKNANRNKPWEAIVSQWAPNPEDAARNERFFELFVARLAADGLWVAESLMNIKLSKEFRDEVGERIAAIFSLEDPNKHSTRDSETVRDL